MAPIFGRCHQSTAPPMMLVMSRSPSLATLTAAPTAAVATVATAAAAMSRPSSSSSSSSAASSANNSVDSYYTSHRRFHSTTAATTANSSVASSSAATLGAVPFVAAGPRSCAFPAWPERTWLDDGMHPCATANGFISDAELFAASIPTIPAAAAAAAAAQVTVPSSALCDIEEHGLAGFAHADINNLIDNGEEVIVCPRTRVRRPAPPGFAPLVLPPHAQPDAAAKTGGRRPHRLRRASSDKRRRVGKRD